MKRRKQLHVEFSNGAVTHHADRIRLRIEDDKIEFWTESTKWAEVVEAVQEVLQYMEDGNDE